LPKENQEAMNSLEWGNLAERIGTKYLLNESQINDFQVQTLLILIGLVDLDSYTFYIENEIGTTKDEATKITEETFEKIFTPINDVLIENIKKSNKIKNPNPEQTLNFILSGGDYSAFLETQNNVNNEEETQETVLPVFSIKEENLKGKFNI